MISTGATPLWSRWMLVAICVACWAAPGFAQQSPAPERTRPDTLTVMTYNVLYATPDTGTIRAIRSVDPDIVALQEVSEPRLQRIARELGYYFHHQGEHEASGANDTGLLSRYPISLVTRYGATIYLTVNDPIHVANVHLTAYPYEPYELRDEAIGPDEAIAQARFTRLPQLKPVLASLDEPLERGDPVFLMGDFNEPSHLDWTADAARAGLHLGMEMNWPSSQEVLRHGFRDAYRTVHPDEVTHPGQTWTTLQGDPNEVHDRIDMIYVAGTDVEAVDAYTVGLRDEPPTDRAVPGYPSDHRAVVAIVALHADADR
jgi:endonuclease/exonuclease/phosphatase family metal-dependent hydrolase